MTADQSGAVASVIRDVLQDAVLGIYLHGSSVFGSLRPTSDLDLFVVTSWRTTEAERRELIERLLQMSGPGDPSGSSRSVDIAIVAQSDVRPWRYPVWLDFQFGDWLRPDFAKGNFAPWDSWNPDLAIVLAVALQASRPLFGPPASELFGPIPWPDIRRAMLESIPDLLSYLDGDERNVVLTFVRIWATLATGVFRSKDRAADWALPLLPPEQRPVLERARSLYVTGNPAEDWGDLMPRIRPFVDHVIGEIEAAARSASPQ